MVPVGVGILVIALVASAAAIIVSRQSSGDPPVDRSPSAQQQPSPGSPVLAWLADNTAPGTSVLVPHALLDRARDRLPDRAVRGYQLGAEHRPDLVVARPGLGNLGEPLRRAAASAPVVVRLGNPTWQVRDMSGGASAEAGVRQEVGRELLENPALTFSDTARESLLAGELDARLLVLLSGMATQVDVLIDLPADSETSPTVPGRVVWIRSIDGEAVAASTVGRVTVNYFVTTQKGPLAATSGQLTTQDGESVLAIRVPLPSPTGLLAGDGMPTTG